MKEPFKPAAYVYVPIILVILLNAIRVMRRGEVTPEGQGELIGGLLIAAIPLIIGYIVWWLTKPDKLASNMTILGIALLLVITQLVQFSSAFVIPQVQRDLDAAKAELDRAIAESGGDPEAIERAQQAWNEATNKGIEDLARAAPGAEGDVLKAMGVFSKEIAAGAEEWRAAFFTIQKPEVFNLEELDQQRNYQFHFDAVVGYRKTTESYRKLVNNAPNRVKELLTPIGLDKPIVIKAQKELNDKFNRQNTVLKPYLNASIKYADAMYAIVEFLFNNDEHWGFEDGQVAFDTDAQVERFNTLIETFVKWEGEMIRLEEKLEDVM